VTDLACMQQFGSCLVCHGTSTDDAPTATVKCVATARGIHCTSLLCRKKVTHDRSWTIHMGRAIPTLLGSSPKLSTSFQPTLACVGLHAVRSRGRIHFQAWRRA
jgi:hypothetical protein